MVTSGSFKPAASSRPVRWSGVHHHHRVGQVVEPEAEARQGVGVDQQPTRSQAAAHLGQQPVLQRLRRDVVQHVNTAVASKERSWNGRAAPSPRMTRTPDPASRRARAASSSTAVTRATRGRSTSVVMPGPGSSSSSSAPSFTPSSAQGSRARRVQELVHAACRWYSWSRPLSRSRRSTRRWLSLMTTGPVGASGDSSPSARWGR